MRRRLVWYVRRREWWTVGVGRWSLTLIWGKWLVAHWLCCHHRIFSPRHRCLIFGFLVLTW